MPHPDDRLKWKRPAAGRIASCRIDARGGHAKLTAVKRWVTLAVLAGLVAALAAPDAQARGGGPRKKRGKKGQSSHHVIKTAPPAWNLGAQMALRAHQRMEALGPPKDYSDQIRQDIYRKMAEFDRAEFIEQREEQFIARIRAEVLAAGGDVNQRDESGRTLLHDAAGMGYTKAVAFLLESGAKPELRDKAGLTARDLAAAIGAEQIDRLLEPPARDR
jgi:hypothetical protein